MGEQIAQQKEQSVLRGPAEQRTGDARQQAEHAQLQGVEQQGVVTRQAQAAQQCTGIEAPRSEDEMRRFCDGIPGPKMANLVEQGDTPLLPPEALGEMGLPNSRMTLSSTTSPSVQTNEVHIYVR